jgi:hypothetical protein
VLVHLFYVAPRPLFMCMASVLRLFLSAYSSQDTTLKLWDRRGKAYNCTTTFSPKSESVR